MRSFKSILRLGLVLPLISIQGAVGDVLIWASDNRSGQPVRAEQAEWLRYLQTQAAANNPLVTPAQVGLSSEYPLHLQAQADLGALMTSRLASGSDAALWIQLNATGLDWVLEQNGQAQQLRTPATSDGLNLGLNWMGMQLSMGATNPAVTDAAISAQPLPTPQPTQAPLQPAQASQPQGYQPSGILVSVGGVFDASDYMRVSQSVRDLEGIDNVYPAKISGTDLTLVISSSLNTMQVQSLLAQQPWLRRTEQGDLRWDALALPLPQGGSALVPAAAVAPSDAVAPNNSAVTPQE